MFPGQKVGKLVYHCIAGFWYINITKGELGDIGPFPSKEAAKYVADLRFIQIIPA